MSALRILLGSLMAAILVTGCLLTGQVVVSFNIPTVHLGPAGSGSSIRIDLNSIHDYASNKSRLEDVSDLAVLGKVTNRSNSAPVTLQFHISRDGAADMEQSAPLWGPLHLEPGESRVIGWDESAALFDPSGKQLLIDEAKGDGVFTLYITDSSENGLVTLENGALVVTLEASN